MSGRRAGNRIRGPQSALTDFLAANNISAAQIRDDYERRRQVDPDPTNAGEGASAAVQQPDEDEDAAAAAAEAAAENTRKRKRNEKEAIEKIKDAKKSKKDKKSRKKKKKGSDDEDQDDNDDDEYDEMAYAKAKPLPGQFEHCELCSKRFTVTPYTKEGPDGGLVCTPCGKQLSKDIKTEQKALAKKPAGRKRRKIESDRLDGVAPNGSKSLQQLCLERAAQYHDDVEELGDMPQPVLERLSEIFSKKRVMNSKTLKLFIRPDLDTVAVHDAAYLQVEDYQQMFAVAPNIKKLVLRNACQFKDECLTYMMDKCANIDYLHLYAANLVTNDTWHTLFRHYGAQLETLKLQWLDAAFEDESVEELVSNCPKLKRLKFKLCRRIGEASINAISRLQHLEHLSLQIGAEVAPAALVNLIESAGLRLRTLSLEHFLDADDTVLSSIHNTCTSLRKLRFSENDTATDAAVVALFTNWRNPPLVHVDFNSTRDIDNNNPTGPADSPIGLASAGFAALMAHSGPALVSLDLSSCRHVGLAALNAAFDGSTVYPALTELNVSFCGCVDTRVVAGVFASCPALRRLIAFGCFDVLDVVVPRGIALIGVPKAQDAIEQIGVGVGIDEAVGRMLDLA